MRVRAISGARFEAWPARGGGLIRTAAPVLAHLDDGRWIGVPGGFWCDGASVPNAAWALLGVGPLRLLVMGLLHDYAVRRGAVLQRDGAEPEPFVVEVATELAVEVARFHGVGPADRWKIGTALWAAQGGYWQRREVLWTP